MELGFLALSESSVVSNGSSLSELRRPARRIAEAKNLSPEEDLVRPPTACAGLPFPWIPMLRGAPVLNGTPGRLVLAGFA